MIHSHWTMDSGGRAPDYIILHDQHGLEAGDILSVDDTLSPEHIDIDDDIAAPGEAYHDSLYSALADMRMGDDRFGHSSGDSCLVLVNFVHDDCPSATRCDPWQAFDFGPFLQQPEPAATTTAESGALRRARTLHHLVQTFQAPVRTVYEQAHGRGSPGEIRAAGARPALGAVHVHWAGAEGRPSGGFAQGVSANLLGMGCATDVKRQLEMIRRRGGRDWVEITYKTEGGPGDEAEEGEDTDGDGRSGDAAISPSLGAPASDGNGGDTQMDSPPPPHRPSSSLPSYGPMHATGHGDVSRGDGGKELEEQLEALAYNNRPQWRAGSNRQRLGQQQELDDAADDHFIPDSQGRLR